MKTRNTGKRRRITSLGAKIIERLREKDKSQRWLALEIGVTPSRMSDILRLRHVNGPLHVRLADALDMSPKALARACEEEDA